MSDHNKTEEVLIERIDGPKSTWLSEKLGRDWGAGQYGGWTDDRSQATVYPQHEAERILEHPLMHVAPYCKVVMK